MNENFIVLNFDSILNSICLSFLLFPIFALIIYWINNNTKKESCTAINPKLFYICWLVMLLMWLPYICTFYPGGIVGDAALTLEMSLQYGLPSHNHWVVLYILVLRLFLNIGKLFSTDINFGVFLYVIFQMILSSYIYTKIALKIYEKSGKRLWLYLIMAMYSLSGFLYLMLWLYGKMGYLEYLLISLY